MLGVGRHEGRDENFGGDKEGFEEDCAKRRRKPTLSTKVMLWRTLLEVTCIFLLMIPMAYIYVFMHGHVAPVSRGFFCDDQNLKHPEVEEKISVGECVIIWGCIAVFIVTTTEFIFCQVHTFPGWDEMMKRLKKEMSYLGRIPVTILQIYRVVGYFVFGGVASLLTTETAKYQIGRLRPYFLTAAKKHCHLELTDELCKDKEFYKFVTEFTCKNSTGGVIDEPKDMMEARKSFLSGHSSFSFYAATFLILYLQFRFYNKTPRSFYRVKDWLKTRIVFRACRIARPFVQFCLFVLALWICLTRIADYKHHPGDVAVGIAVGVFWALLVHAYIMELAKKPLSFWNSGTKVRDDIENIEQRHQIPLPTSSSNRQLDPVGGRSESYHETSNDRGGGSDHSIRMGAVTNSRSKESLGERRKERTIGGGVEAGGAARERGVDQPGSLSPPASMSPHQSAQRVTSADSRRKFFEHKHQ